jgi:hypothetical protein
VNNKDKVQIQDIYSDTKLNHYLSQKLKLTKNSNFNHLINTLTLTEALNPMEDPGQNIMY